MLLCQQTHKRIQIITWSQLNQPSFPQWWRLLLTRSTFIKSFTVAVAVSKWGCSSSS